MTDPSPNLACVVGLGGPGGSPRAFDEILRHAPTRSGIAYLVAATDEASPPLGPALSLETSLPIVVTREPVPIEPDRIYVAEAGRTLELRGTIVRSQRADVHRDHFTDRLFESLAASFGRRAVGVLVTGPGADGIAGLRRVQTAGGVVLRVDPSARADRAGPADPFAADQTLSCADVGPTLAGLFDDRTRRYGTSIDDLDLLEEICSLLLVQTGHDFSAYKRSTLARRVEKRIQSRHAPSLSAYLKILEEDVVEGQALLKDFLITVTHFFRDPHAFDALRQTVIAPLVDAASGTEAIRVWVPACATGEEAYTLAILLKEEVAKRDPKDRPAIQVFATDIDRSAIDVARQGKYAIAALEQLPDAYAGYFKRTDEGLQVSPELREACVFSEHSLIKDPPFSRIDLISCRNLFIYWRSDLQAKVLPIFHYALRPNGFLFLGAAENITGTAHLFRTLDKKNRIFQRIPEGTGSRLAVLPTSSIARMRTPPSDARRLPPFGERDLTRRISATLLEGYAPPAVVISEYGEIIFYSGRTGRYLEPPTGSPSHNIFDVVRKALRPDLHALVHRATKGQASVVHPGIAFEVDGLVQRVSMVVRPMPELARGLNLYMVVFQEIGPTQTKDEALQDGVVLPRPESLVQQLEAELRDTREHLQSTIEEVKSSNEELLSMNEELQSANEELQTSKEELQSANEELETLNLELSRKVEELDHANSDLQNFFANTQVPTLFLDAQCRVQSFTPSSSSLFRLIPTDVGRSITDITSLVDGDLQDQFRAVIQSLQPVEKAVRSKDGARHFIMRVSPYRTLGNVIDGVVVTFSEVTELKKMQELHAGLAAIVESSSDAIFGVDPGGAITSWNAGAERLYWYGTKEAVGQSASIIVPPDEAATFDAMRQRAMRGEDVSAIETERVRKDGKRVWVWLTVSPIRDPSGAVTGISIITRDTTDHRRAEEAQARLAALVESSDDAIIGKDLDGVVTSWNRGAERLFGYTAEEMVGKPVFRLVPPEGPDDILPILQAVRRGEVVHNHETVRLHKNGRRIDVSLSVSPIRDASGRIVGVSKIARDITERLRAERTLQQALRLRDEFITLASHELKTPLTSMKLQAQMVRRSAAKLGTPPAPEQAVRFAARVERQIDRLTVLVNDMLDVSRIGAGRLHLHRERVDLSDVTRDVVADLAEHLVDARCTVRASLAEGVVGAWDRGRLEQVVTNVLVNASRYGSGKPIDVRTETEGDAGVVEVRDQGIGIAKSDQERIFQQFERGAGAGEGGAFGIGLYIVREIAHAHGGRVTVASDLGRGATFRVILPRIAQ